MKKRIPHFLFVLIALLLAIGGTADARDSTRIARDIFEHPPWYLQTSKPETLRGAMAATKEFLGEDNPGYGMIASGKLCDVLTKVGLPSDYNSRSDLSMFLTVNGKGLFPAAGGTNHHARGESYFKDWPDDVYIGTAEQNRMLASAVRRNADLFQDSDLTAEDVRERWR